MISMLWRIMHLAPKPPHIRKLEKEKERVLAKRPDHNNGYGMFFGNRASRLGDLVPACKRFKENQNICSTAKEHYDELRPDER